MPQFNIRSQNEGNRVRFRPPAGGGRVRMRRPNNRPEPVDDESEDESEQFESRPSRRDAFGVPEDDDAESISAGSSVSFGRSSRAEEEEEDDEFGMLANQDRLLPSQERPPSAPPPQARRFSSSAPPSAAAPPSRPFVGRQPDFLNQKDDGFIAPADENTLDNQKLELLHKVQRMAASGTPPQVALSMDSSFEQINLEYQRMRKNAEIMRSIKFQRRILLAVSTGVEFLSKRAGFLKLRLDGFSESVLDSIADYDDSFEDLHGRYGESVSMDPMYSVLFMFLSSMVAYHISNAMFSSVLPSVTQTLSNSPEILAQVTEAMRGFNSGGPAAKPAPAVAPPPPKICI
jgi:hypothetical protein